MLPASVASLARVECLAQELDYECPFSYEAENDAGRVLDELTDYVSDDADVSDEVREEFLRRIDELREALEEES